MPGAVPELWRQQGDVLRKYTAEFATKPDVAIELPTGTGKTIVGLLIADWRRRKHRQPVAYACPTHQLAHQVARAARREGIPSVTLVGSHTTWPQADLSSYDSAEAIAITTYSAVFNVSPKIGSPGALVFDDAHAGEQFVAEAWSVEVERQVYPSEWGSALDAVRAGLDGMFIQRLDTLAGDLSVQHDVRLVVPSRRPGMVARLDAALGELPAWSDPWFRRSMIRGGLESCLVYVSSRSILVRPFIPPTSENRPFAGAGQRVYLSATLGRGGELERAFGRSTIARLPLPADARNPRSGRRYFVFADLVTGDSDMLAAAVTAAAGKALVLAPSTERAMRTARELNQADWQILGKGDVELSLDPFAKAEHALLALAGRYDGIDLPDNACRLVVLEGLPTNVHLQEQFLAGKLRARIALEERTRTRVVQGAGRATRNPSDHAIVVVRGLDLTRYISNPSVRAALDPDLQAEIAFGLDNSRGELVRDVLENATIFLQQGDEWREGAEPHLADARRAVDRIDPQGSDLLSAAAPHEVEATARAWRADFVGAREAAMSAAAALSGDESVRSYRAFWLYLASVWSFAAASSDPSANKTGAGLLAQAQNAARGTTWLRETDPGTVALEDDADDTPAVRTIAAKLGDGVSRGDIERAATAVCEGLAAIEHTKSEVALTGLGRLLGADAYKPAGQGRCDSAWCWDERVWLALEAKTEHEPTGEIHMKDVRQANTQLDSLSSDRGVVIPDMAATIIISPRQRISADAMAIARRELHLANPDVVRRVASDATNAWTDLLARHQGHSGPDLDVLVRRVLADWQVLPSQVRERLTSDPIKS